MSCHCITNKNQRCKLQVSKKSSDDNQYCWRHQDCARSVGDSMDNISDTKPKRKVLKKTVKKSVRKTPKKTVRKMARKTARKTAEKSTKKSVRKISTSPQKAPQKSLDKSVCSLPSPVRANIVENLNKWQVDKLCQTSKTCDKNICKNKDLWTSLTKQKFEKSPGEEEDPRKFYYSQTTNLYGTGITENGLLGPDNQRIEWRKNEILLQKGVRYASLGGEHSAFIDINDKLYVLGSNQYNQIGIVKGETFEPVEIMDNVKKVVALYYSTFILDSLGNLYMMGDYQISVDKKTLIMKSVKDIGRFGGNDIYIITKGNHYLIQQLPDTKFHTKDLEIYSTDTDESLFNKYFVKNDDSVSFRNRLVEIRLRIKNSDLSNKIKLFQESRIFFDHGCQHRFYGVLLTDNRLIATFTFKDCQDQRPIITETIPNVKTFYGMSEGLIWADVQGKLYYMPIFGSEKFQKIELESHPVVKIRSKEDIIYILTNDGDLFSYDPIKNIRFDVATGVVDFDISEDNKYFIKYLFYEV